MTLSSPSILEHGCASWKRPPWWYSVDFLRIDLKGNVWQKQTNFAHRNANIRSFMSSDVLIVSITIGSNETRLGRLVRAAITWTPGQQFLVALLESKFFPLNVFFTPSQIEKNFKTYGVIGREAALSTKLGNLVNIFERGGCSFCSCWRARPNVSLTSWKCAL